MCWECRYARFGERHFYYVFSCIAAVSLVVDLAFLVQGPRTFAVGQVSH